jgi:DNA modification methylase
MKTFHDGKVTLHAGDCLDVLKAVPENSIDAVVTDPPYHLTSIVKRFANAKASSEIYAATSNSASMSRGFMGQKWDGGDIAFQPELWTEVLRVLKPGGHMVCFGGTRTYHRLACAIEDAGFEIRDQLAWVYGSGFPKSHNQGNGWGTALKPAWEPICLARKPLSESTVAANVLRWGTGALNIDGCRITVDAADQAMLDAAVKRMTGNAPNAGAFQKSKVIIPNTAQGRWPANLCHDGSPEVMAGFPESISAGGDGYKNSMFCGGKSTGGHGLGDSGSAARFFYTAKAGSWDRINRVIETLEIEWNTGQEPRLATLQVDTEQLHGKGIVVSPSDASNGWNTFLSGSNITDLCRKASKCTIKTATSSTTSSQTWSWLTRLLTKESIPAANCEMVNGSSHVETAEMSGPSLIITLGETASLPGASRAVSGTQLRISVSAKQHGHPTIKPVNLMQWLVRLVCPKGATVLDPFAGTGTTGAAAFIEGCRSVLIEREAEYLADIERRMGLLLSGRDERARKLAQAEPYEILPLFA